jgi:hypothetical protein
MSVQDKARTVFVAERGRAAQALADLKVRGIVQVPIAQSEGDATATRGRIDRSGWG